MEYGLHESFPIYSGGLGVLAGDILKTAKDLKIPMIGVGILWAEGYTDQFLDREGNPYDCAQHYDRAHLTDTAITITLPLRGEDVLIKVWRTEGFQNVPLYLLDADTGYGTHAWMTRQLYGGTDQDRLAAEMILGIGGVRALRKLGLSPPLYHINEGHGVFAGLELLREYVAEGLSFEEAWEKTREKVVFTTHTPVLAGNEEHSHGLLLQMGAYNGLTRDQMVAIGGDPFNMTIAGLRLSFIANGVSKLHGITARSMWQGSEGIAPIVAITNGVRQGSWQHPKIRAARNREDIWTAHKGAKTELLRYISQRTGVSFDPERLLLGFARRVAPYKRNCLLFHRLEILEPLLKEEKLQLVYAGKAHPRDLEGKQMIKDLVQFSKRYAKSFVFLENYDMQTGRLVTAGCDVWLNHPQRPLEASGTSGMKAGMNGVLNISVLDGWWPEGCLHGVNGWQVGGGYEGAKQYLVDACSLYQVLLSQVIPLYYEDKEGWLDMMQESIRMTTSRFTTERMLLEYQNLLYWPQTTLNRLEMDAMFLPLTKKD